MVLQCRICGATTAKDNVSLFSVPQNSNRRDLWNRILGHPDRQLQSKDVLCENHFDPNDVMKFLKINDVKLPYKKVRLRKGCLPVPCLKQCNPYIETKKSTNLNIIYQPEFVNTENNTSVANGRNIEIQTTTVLDMENQPQLINTEETSFLRDGPNIKIKEESGLSIKDEPEFINTADSNFFLNEPNGVTEEVTLSIKNEPEFTNTEGNTFLPDPINTGDIKEEPLQFHAEDAIYFFDDIFNTNTLIGLTEYWGIHSCDPNKTKIKPCMVLLTERKPKLIVFSQVHVQEGVPVTGKQVILNEDLEVKYFVRQNEINHLSLPTSCTSPEILLHAVNEFSKFKLCKGGPSSNEFKEIAFVTSCAYKDYGSMTWRHKLCDFFAAQGLETCVHCVCLSKYFKITMNRSKTLKRLRREMGPDVSKWKCTLRGVRRSLNRSNNLP